MTLTKPQPTLLYMNSSENTPPQHIKAPQLAAGGWFPPNRTAITSQLQHTATSSPSQPNIAVFDFDNTCVFRDVGQVTFRYQLLHLRYRLTPEQFAQLLPEQSFELAGRSLATIKATLCACYHTLWADISQGNQARACQRPEYERFTGLLAWFVAMARKHADLGPRYVLPLMGKLLAGHSITELKQFAREVILSVGQEPLEERQLIADGGPELGQLTSSYLLGLHPYPEMQDLIRTLNHYGIHCYIVSASTGWLVEEAAQLLDFAVPNERIYGIRVALEREHILGIGDPVDYPITFREGKADVIQRLIGSTPFLVAGDADTDYEMLTLPGVSLRLLLHRQQQGVISTLYQNPEFLVQGLDLQAGRFQPTRDSVA